MKTQIKTINSGLILKAMLMLAILVACFYASNIAAAPGTGDLGSLAQDITGRLSGLVQLMIAIAYLAGIGFVLASIFKFKQHKDNPTQIPLGTPLALLVIGIVLIFLPMIFQPAGQTIFGEGATPGGITGGGFTTIPGSDNAGGGP